MSWTFVVLALVLFLFAIYIGFLCWPVGLRKARDHQARLLDRQFCRRGGVVLLTWVFSLFPLVQFAPIRLARRLYRRP